MCQSCKLYHGFMRNSIIMIPLCQGVEIKKACQLRQLIHVFLEIAWLNFIWSGWQLANAIWVIHLVHQNESRGQIKVIFVCLPWTPPSRSTMGKVVCQTNLVFHPQCQHHWHVVSAKMPDRRHYYNGYALILPTSVDMLSIKIRKNKYRYNLSLCQDACN